MQSQIVVRKEFLDAVQVTLELTALKDRAASDALAAPRGVVRGQAAGLEAQVPLVLGEPLNLEKYNLIHI